MQNITEQKLQFYKSIIELKEDKLTNEDFVDTIKNEVLHNNIYVYTPKGDVIELPKGATPIDFAYKIHSQIGDKLTGAIVNNSMVPLTYELQNTDVIKVITNNNSKGPSREWINIAKTTSAKNKIKNFFNRTTKEDYINRGKELLEKELRRKKITYSDFMSDENLEKVFKQFKLENLEDLYLCIGNNKISAKGVVKQEKEEQNEEIKQKPVVNAKDSDILVGDTANIEVHIANCCLPLPGDEIVGYITRTNGIRIHRKECTNIELFENRIVDAKWNAEIINKYNSELIIHTNSQENILVDIVHEASSMGITIENVNLLYKSNNNVYSVDVLVKDLETMEKFMINLNKLKYVNDVERIMR
jgi:GTP pyrophosphokinase